VRELIEQVDRLIIAGDPLDGIGGHAIVAVRPDWG
jgi:hypothetical protein